MYQPTQYKSELLEALAKIAFEVKFDDFDSRSYFSKLTYLVKDRRFREIGPRRQKRKFHSKWNFVRASLLFGIFLLLLTSCHKKQELKPTPPVPVVAVEAISDSVPLYIETVGHMEAYNTVNIMAQADGTLLQTHFEDGADVKQGELLYSIDPAPYLADLELAKGKLKQQLAEFSYAKRNAERNAPLVQDDYISKDDYDSIETTVIADNALVEQMRADVKTAEINLSYTEIYSPLDARGGF